MTTYTYTVLDVERTEIIGFIEAGSQYEAVRTARLEFNSKAWNDRFPFEVEVGRELAIRPDYDQDPYFSDLNATTIKSPKTYRVNNHTQAYFQMVRVVKS